jgi:hypothetical protein
MQPGTESVNLLNLEYFFRFLYNLRPGGSAFGEVNWESISDYLLHAWSTLGAVSFVFSLGALIILAYATVRMYQVKERMHHDYVSDLDPEVAEHAKDLSRWAHIQTLIESAQERDWREAIMEADIMLEDMLVERGYAGDTTGERLKNVDRNKFKTLPEAWEAHKVRNQIAHEGIAFPLSDQLAYRTIKRYEAVFKEFGEL